MQLLTETHLMSPVLISSPSKIHSLFHHWVLQMQGMRCLGQAGTEFGGAEEPWEHPTPLLLCSLAAGWTWMGGSSLDAALSSLLVVPGQKMLLFVITWQAQFPLTQQKRFEPTNSCNNFGKCQKKKKKSQTIPGASGFCHSKWNVYIRRIESAPSSRPLICTRLEFGFLY